MGRQLVGVTFVTFVTFVISITTVTFLFKILEQKVTKVTKVTFGVLTRNFAVTVLFSVYCRNEKGQSYESYTGPHARACY